MNYYYTLILAALMSTTLTAKMVEYIEDAYLVQAPQKLVTLADKAAELAGYDKNYEITIAKKAGIQINPWNNFISLSSNPQTQNPVIIINPTWFNELSEDQQLFLLVRCFITMQQGTVPTSMKVLPFIFMVISLILITLFYILLGKTQLIHKKWWLRLLIAIAIMSFLNLTVTNKIAKKLNVYLAYQHDNHIITSTIEKTGNKEAALTALEHIDASIKKELSAGETFWQPFDKIFENYANALKSQNID